MIEDALRETFAAKVDGAPPLAGLADQAIGHGRRVRSRQAVSIACAGVIALAIASVVTVQAIGGSPARRSDGSSGTDIAVGEQRDSSGPPVASRTGGPSSAARPLEVLVDGEIHAENRKLLVLQGKTHGLPVSRAFRVSDGYLLVTPGQDPLSQRLWLVDPQGQQTPVVDGATSIAISANGAQVAWRAGDKMSVADRKTGGKLSITYTIKTPTSGGPIDFVGTDVLLGRTLTGGDLDAFDVWHPDHNSYTETWSTNIVRIFGAQPDGKGLYAQILANASTKQTCLARLVPAQPTKNEAFTVVQKACGLPAPLPLGGGVSPDGRWLAYTVLSDDGTGTTRMAVVSLDGVFLAKPPSPQFWDVSPVHTVWLGPKALAVDTGGQIVTIDPTQPSKKPDLIQPSNPGKVLIQPLGG